MCVLLFCLEEAPILSFDCEMTPEMKAIVLIQAATLCGSSFVFDIRKISASQLDRLASVFRNKQIYKFGSGCNYDVTFLNKLHNFNVAKFYEFAPILHNVVNESQLEFLLCGKKGLKSMCQKLMGFGFNKLHWKEYEKFALDEIPQKLITYSALDVLTLIDLYLNLYFYHRRMKPLSANQVRRHVGQFVTPNLMELHNSRSKHEIKQRSILANNKYSTII